MSRGVEVYFKPVGPTPLTLCQEPPAQAADQVGGSVEGARGGGKGKGRSCCDVVVGLPIKHHAYYHLNRM